LTALIASTSPVSATIVVIAFSWSNKFAIPPPENYFTENYFKTELAFQTKLLIVSSQKII
jgi:hypothetical protein